MAQREQTIAVSEAEKQSLNDVAEAAFGTAEVPYGSTVSMLCTEYLNSEE